MWTTIDGFTGYEVSDEGVVRNAETGHVMRGVRGGGKTKEWIVCADKPTRAMERMHVGDVVRCRDCASIKPTTDGRRYCQRWSHIVPLDGYCWRGEAKSGEEAQEG